MVHLINAILLNFVCMGTHSIDQASIQPLVTIIHQELLPQLVVESVHPHNPAVVHHLPPPWELIGTGNYAAVVCHPDFPDVVVKIYAPGRPGFDEELEVYNRIGSHPAYSQCFYAYNGLLVLKRLFGVTLYDCLNRGLRIPVRVIKDIDRALDYARSRGLFPHDVHGKNVMMFEGRGLVVDISDFLHEDKCSKWEDLKKAYYLIYLPFFYPFKLRVPYSLLNQIRQSYRFISSFSGKILQFLKKLIGQKF
ncbi:serine/threonine protein kinase [Cylindrospermopsis raciborskii S07]|nr:serine/threonine protein kinase [Cylindrospermopsis raciborskii C04]PNJ95582.1 serine/threonine protein kinase [Cylindrospermopsis raciborskii C03]PNJ99521.1 serine/threonine protein kinase [Cylindrospermopsis raciborskii C07]PNK06281.1 serine/threonine protein kinase [Cylindrospermopsis raciborskii S14]PNK07842.1 serine/threonine protein kinase [Cylindrospermopsis raciborskii S10]PNK10659.1 serine/threonine protein kinase [Cylindrospermopsis raciborskii S07]PNK14810.1 serine/threonine pro